MNASNAMYGGPLLAPLAVFILGYLAIDIRQRNAEARRDYSAFRSAAADPKSVRFIAKHSISEMRLLITPR
jgi:hypothetical protein